MSMYNFNHLYYFYVTARSGGVTVASEHLHITQPALSGQLKVLEENLGVKLFQRVGRRIVLTQQGKIVYDICREMFEVSERLTEKLSKRCSIADRQIHIGVSGDIEAFFTAKAVGHFLFDRAEQQRPQILIEGFSHQELVNKLHFKEVDIIVTSEPAKGDSLIPAKKVSSDIVLASSWKADYEHDLQSLDRKGQWVFCSDHSQLRVKIDDIIEQQGIKGKSVIDTYGPDQVKTIVSMGVGQSFFPLPYISDELASAKMHTINATERYGTYDTYIFYHPCSRGDHLISSLIDEILKGTPVLTVTPPQSSRSTGGGDTLSQ